MSGMHITDYMFVLRPISSLFQQHVHQSMLLLRCFTQSFCQQFFNIVWAVFTYWVLKLFIVIDMLFLWSNKSLFLQHIHQSVLLLQCFSQPFCQQFLNVWTMLAFSVSSLPKPDIMHHLQWICRVLNQYDNPVVWVMHTFRMSDMPNTHKMLVLWCCQQLWTHTWWYL